MTPLNSNIKILISQFYCIFNQINAALVSIKVFFVCAYYIHTWTMPSKGQTFGRWPRGNPQREQTDRYAAKVSEKMCSISHYSETVSSVTTCKSRTSTHKSQMHLLVRLSAGYTADLVLKQSMHFYSHQWLPRSWRSSTQHMWWVTSSGPVFCPAAFPSGCDNKTLECHVYTQRSAGAFILWIIQKTKRKKI